MYRKLLASCLLCLICASPSVAQNPRDLRDAQQAAQRAHNEKIAEIATLIGKSPDYVSSFLDGGSNADKRLSTEVIMDSHAFRKIKQLMGERNEAVKDAYDRRGLIIPPGLNRRLSL